MIRMYLPHEDGPSRTLDATDFIREIEAFQDGGFAEAPPGPVVIEMLDCQGRVLWKAFYPTFPRLAALARELREEHAARERAAAASDTACESRG